MIPDFYKYTREGGKGFQREREKYPSSSSRNQGTAREEKFGKGSDASFLRVIPRIPSHPIQEKQVSAWISFIPQLHLHKLEIFQRFLGKSDPMRGFFLGKKKKKKQGREKQSKIFWYRGIKNSPHSPAPNPKKNEFFGLFQQFWEADGNRQHGKGREISGNGKLGRQIPAGTEGMERRAKQIHLPHPRAHLDFGALGISTGKNSAGKQQSLKNSPGLIHTLIPDFLWNREKSAPSRRSAAEESRQIF